MTVTRPFPNGSLFLTRFNLSFLHSASVRCSDNRFIMYQKPKTAIKNLWLNRTWLMVGRFFSRFSSQLVLFLIELRLYSLKFWLREIKCRMWLGSEVNFNLAHADLKHQKDSWLIYVFLRQGRDGSNKSETKEDIWRAESRGKMWTISLLIHNLLERKIWTRMLQDWLCIVKIIEFHIKSVPYESAVRALFEFSSWVGWPFF